MSNRPIFPPPGSRVQTVRRRLIAGLLVATLLVAELLAASTRRTGTTELSLGPAPRAAPTTISWPDDQELPTFATPDSPLTYVDLTAASDDDKALVVSLQGLVNSRRLRLCIGTDALDRRYPSLSWEDTVPAHHAAASLAAELTDVARQAQTL